MHMDGSTTGKGGKSGNRPNLMVIIIIINLYPAFLLKAASKWLEMVTQTQVKLRLSTQQSPRFSSCFYYAFCVFGLVFSCHEPP